MSTTNNTPTKEQLRQARRAGFSDTISYMDKQKQEKLARSYVKQDDRREKNISSFVGTITGNGK